jgi:1-Cys peroxiredoxin 6
VAALSEKAEFSKRNTKVLAISCNDTESHQGWIQDINASQSCTVEFPIIADPTREIAVKWGMLDETDKDAAGLPMTVRSVFIISPDKSLKLMLAYPASTGRNFAEIIRVLDSLQLTASHKVATPVNWEQGGDCMVLPTVKPEDTAALFPKGVDVLNVPSGKPYLRQTPQPNV